jgi:hypothetical protein
MNIKLACPSHPILMLAVMSSISERQCMIPSQRAQRTLALRDLLSRVMELYSAVVMSASHPRSVMLARRGTAHAHLTIPSHSHMTHDMTR